MKKQFVTRKYISEIETNDSLSQDIFDDILGKNWEDENNEYPETIEICLKDNIYGGVSIPIEISKLKTLLKKLEIKGANYVEIMYHTDHVGYVLNGVKIDTSTDKEIKDFNTQLKELFKKQKI